MSEPLFERLQRYFAEREADATVSDFRFVTSGWESDVYSFVLHRPQEAPRPLILRLYPNFEVAPKMQQEAAGLRRLHEAGYPVPALFLTETQSPLLGKPFTLLEKLEGRALWPILAEADSVQADALLDRFGRLLAELHQVDWRPFTADADRYAANPVLLLDELFAEAREQFTRFQVPGFLSVLDWLDTHKAALTIRPAVVHLDFHANNVFVCADGRWVVIDWTQVTVMDYRADLGWTRLIMGEFGKPQWAERILQAYRQAVPYPVEDLDYCDAMAYLKNLASTVIALLSGPEGLGLRAETVSSAKQKAPVIRAFAQRIDAITGLTIPEVEAILRQV